jgi:hypothetical protein
MENDPHHLLAKSEIIATCTWMGDQFLGSVWERLEAASRVLLMVGYPEGRKFAAGKLIWFYFDSKILIKLFARSFHVCRWAKRLC